MKSKRSIRPWEKIQAEAFFITKDLENCTECGHDRHMVYYCYGKVFGELKEVQRICCTKCEKEVNNPVLKSKSVLVEVDPSVIEICPEESEQVKRVG